MGSSTLTAPVNLRVSARHHLDAKPGSGPSQTTCGSHPLASVTDQFDAQPSIGSFLPEGGPSGFAERTFAVRVETGLVWTVLRARRRVIPYALLEVRS